MKRLSRLSPRRYLLPALRNGFRTGLVESLVLKKWMSSGLWGNKIAGYAPVNVYSLDSLRQAIAYFGGVYVGIQVPTNAMEQFQAGQGWTLVSDWPNQSIEGGHAIPILDYDDQWMYCVRGAVQQMAYRHVAGGPEERLSPA